MVPREAGEVDVGEGDGVADPWLAVRRPVRQVGQGAAEVVLGRLGLGERRAVELLRANVPAAVGGSTWLARLDLDDKQAELGMNDDEVRLAVVRRPRAPGPGAPADVLVDAVLGWEGRPERLVDVPLGGLPARLGDLVDQPAPPLPARTAYGTAVGQSSGGRNRRN